ncbi:tRNA 2-selenouridine(34) synthase MnmH [soil metagenome]
MEDPIRIGAAKIDGPWSEVIDVRSPSEFAEDHVPGAINLPVLSDDERAVVGKMYVRDGAFLARRHGAALITANISRLLGGHFCEKPPGYRPLVYCWRGGQRSGSLATILAAVGWPVAVLEGGYKAYRQWVRDRLGALAAPGRLRLRVIGGLTGSGKTLLLGALAAAGEQVLDLEGLANHRGSQLGRAFPEPGQPTQKAFETSIVAALEHFDPGRTVFVEAESNKVGKLHVPGDLWARMREAPVTELVVPSAARAEFLVGDYPHFVRDAPHFVATLEPLRHIVGTRCLERWKALAEAGAWREMVVDLLESHYDPSYLRSRDRIFQPADMQIEMGEISAASIAAAVAKLRPG